MQSKLSGKMKAGMAALTLQFGVIASVHAGGATLLHLPIEGITTENSDQCAELFEKKFGPVLINWKGGDVTMIKDGSTNLVQLRPARGHISLSDAEKALKGSPFSIKRDQLEYFSLLRFHIGKVAKPEKHVNALATLDGKKLQAYSVENADGSLWITLRHPVRNTAVSFDRKRRQEIITHQRLTNYLSEHGINLIEISWGNVRGLEPDAETFAEVWRGNAYGARPAA